MLTIADLGEIEQYKGKVLVSDWYTMTQATIDAFADVAGDHQWIHVDPVRAAAESPFGTTIAHGFLTLSLLSTLFAQCCRINSVLSINYGFDRVRFSGPVRAGARIRGRFSLAEVSRREATAQTAWHVEVEVEGAPKPALIATWLIRIVGDHAPPD